MKREVKSFIEENQILDNVKTILLAVSGGADSMALAHFMLEEYPSYHYIIGHVNHLLRKSAEKDSALVADFAAFRNVPFYLLKEDVAALAKAEKKGVEEVGREVRYGFFRSFGCDLILTAHHKDDDAETILSHLIRGCGLKGLCGISPREGNLGRPFLCLTKDVLETYCQANKILYHIDETNEDTVYQRNKIRHEVLPLLASMNPNIVESFVKLKAIAAEDEETLNQLAAQAYRKLVKEEDGRLLLKKSLLDAEKQGIQSRVLRMAGEKMAWHLDFQSVQKIRALKTGKELHFGSHGRVLQNGKYYIFEPEKLQADVLAAEDFLAIHAPGLYDSPWGQWQVCEITEKSKDKNSFYLDKETLELGITLRTWETGDRFFLKNGGRKKLSDWFIDQKIPKEERCKIPILVQNQEILWIFGYSPFKRIKKPVYQLKFYEKNK